MLIARAHIHFSYSNHVVSEAAITAVRLVNGKETRSILSQQIPTVDETPTTQSAYMERFVGLEWKCAVQSNLKQQNISSLKQMPTYPIDDCV